MQLYEQIEVSGDNITLSLIIWRRFHRPMPGLAEETLDINQNLADLGDFIPVGTKFLLPIRQEKEEVLSPISLW